MANGFTCLYPRSLSFEYFSNLFLYGSLAPACTGRPLSQLIIRRMKATRQSKLVYADYQSSVSETTYWCKPAFQISRSGDEFTSLFLILLITITGAVSVLFY